MHVVSLVSDAAGTRELRELSLALETPRGMVVVAGCSHPGIERIVEAATGIDWRVRGTPERRDYLGAVRVERWA